MLTPDATDLILVTYAYIYIYTLCNGLKTSKLSIQTSLNRTEQEMNHKETSFAFCVYRDLVNHLVSFHKVRVI